MHKFSYKSLFIILFFLLIGVVVLSRFVLPDKKVSAGWWNDSWNYRQAINISSHNTSESNVYIITSVNIGTTTKSQIDNGDFRFITQTGDPLSYYISSGVGTTNITFHIQFSSFPSGAQTIYAYYGNSTVADGFSSSDFSTEASNYTIGSLSAEEVGGGPVAYWKFDEGVGTTVYDSNSTITGLLTGSTIPIWQDEDKCISGKCLDFNGSGYINVGNPSSFDIPNNSITIETWVKFNYLDYTNNTGGLLSLIGKGHPDTAPGTSSFGFWLTYDNRNNRNSFTYTCFGNSAGGYAGGVNNFSTSNYNFEENTWYHIAVTIFQDEGRLFINGKQIGATRTFSGLQINNTTDNLYIGRATAGFNNGLQDEVKIYPYARTADQIKLDYNSRGSSKGSSVNLGVKSSTAPTLSSKLIAHWKFDEGQGTTAKNSISSNFNGTLSGATTPTWFNDGKFNKALSFNGVNSFVNLGNLNNLSGNSETVSFWAKTSDITDFGGFIDSSLGGGTTTIRFYIGYYHSSSPYFYVWLGDGTSHESFNFNYTIPLNIWQHYSVVLDGNSLKLYINGKLYSTKNVTKTLATGTYSIGKGFGGAGYFNGLIDEVKIYNSALTDEEIKQDYNAGATVQFGVTNQTIGGTTTSLEYCIPGDTSHCASPIAEWKMDERNGSTIKDTSGNNNTGNFGTGNSAPTWTSGKIGAGLNFDGNNDFITITNSTSLQQTSDYTLETWFKPLNNTVSFFILKNGEYGFRWNGSTSALEYYDEGYKNSSKTSWNLGQWYQLSMVKIGSTISLYVDGNLDSSGSSTAAHNTAYDLEFGRYGGNYFNGLIDHTKIYNYARTPAQIAWDYNKGEPVGWWKFDECQGNIAKDSSGIGNTGVINIGSSGTQNALGTCQVGTSAAWTNGATGKINSSLSLDGTDDYINMGDPANNSLDFGINDFTTVAWFKTTSTAASIILGKYSTYPLFYTRFNNGVIESRIGFDASTNFTNTTGTATNDDNWHQIVVVYKRNGNMTKYIDGKVYGTSTDISPSSSTSVSTTNSFTVGASGGSTQFFSGQIDDVRIYNYALTPEQVKQVYNGGAVNFQ